MRITIDTKEDSKDELRLVQKLISDVLNQKKNDDQLTLNQVVKLQRELECATPIDNMISNFEEKKEESIVNVNPINVLNPATQPVINSISDHEEKMIKDIHDTSNQENRAAMPVMSNIMETENKTVQPDEMKQEIKNVQPIMHNMMEQETTNQPVYQNEIKQETKPIMQNMMTQPVMNNIMNQNINQKNEPAQEVSNSPTEAPKQEINIADMMIKNNVTADELIKDNGVTFNNEISENKKKKEELIPY